MAEAQEKQGQRFVRCATEEAMMQNFRLNPALKEEYDRKNSINGIIPSSNGTARISSLTGPVTIPVIVHVVLPNPNIITEEQIDYFINRLNLDFSGLNPDSTNGTLFYPVRGHSLLRFTRARRTPSGQLTNGIERRVGTTLIGGNTYQPIKHTSDGGLDPWDVTQYYNLWVGDGGASGILGIAPGIGVGNQTETTSSTTGIDGVCVSYLAFSNGCFSDVNYNLARTAVHEIGHNFSLYHIFSGCAVGADFAQPTPAGQTLPANLVGTAGDDTPSQSAQTTNCPTGAVASNCAGVANPPGKMYQNFMDYTADACYSMFTKNQVERMHYMLETYRPGYLTTQGAVPPASFPAIDAGLNAIVSPGGSEFNNATCAITNYPVLACAGSFVPRVSVTNFGSSTITSITATVTVNGTTSAPINFPVNLITNRTTTLSFPAQNLVVGTNNITFTITAVNGAADTYTTNNTISTSVSVTSGAFPFAQDFVTTTFPPANMSIFNPNGNVTWTRRANGNVTAGSAFINNYDNNFPNQIDDIRTQPLTPPTGASNTDSLIISFDLAHRPFSATTTVNADTLKVLVSTDCGVTFTQVYARWNRSTPSLATAAALATSYLTPVASDWRRETISLPGSYFTGGNIIVAFRNINRYGNNIFLDNINVEAKIVTRRDVSVAASNLATITCNTVSPVITVRNPGRDTVSSYKLGYNIDNGTVTSITRSNVVFVPGTTRNDTLTNITLPAGVHTIKFFTFEPVSSTGTGDQNVTNDTLTRTIRVFGTQAAPLVEGFDATTFPPANWVVNNPDNQTTWTRTTTASRSGVASAYINNFNYANPGARDELYSPQVTYSGADSVFLTFDVAAATYSYPGSTAIPLDTLEVLVTNNCGVTYTSVYKKWGAQLQTINDPNTPNAAEFTPRLASQWRNEKIDLSFYSSRSPIEVVFRSTNNYENNIYLDNVNLSTKTLPARLKEQGYLIYPTLFNTSFTIQHYLTPSDLRGMAVYNSIGQRVLAQTFGSTGASSSMQIDMSRFASGMYTVVLQYANRTISQKIMKVH